MKLYIFTILALLLLSIGTVHAQNINIGTKIGLNSYTIDSGNNAGVDVKLGIHAGLIGHIHVSPQFALQSELVYSMQGAKVGGTSFNLDYFNIPILLQYMFDNGFRIQAGPQLGILVHAEASNNGTIDIRDNYEALDVGLGFGVGYIHTPSNFGIDFRYNLGLTDITKASGADATNRGVQVGIFYLFNHY